MLQFYLSSLCFLISKFEAIQAQFVTAIAAFIGTGVGLLAERNFIIEEVLLSSTAGGFMYIATVHMIGKLLQGKRVTKSAIQVGLESIAFFLGVSLMAAVLLLEVHDDHDHHKDSHDHKHHH